MHEKDNRWLRRGHEYKPNAIVRGVYAITDWLSDFAPMMDTAKQGVINSALVFSNFIILVGIVVTSAVHSLELLRFAGATGGLEYALLIVWEALFLTSSLLVDQALKRGIGNIKQSWQVWLPFILSLVFVLASNIIGMAGNTAGLLLGIATPILLLLIKWMLGWQLDVRAKFDANEREEKAKKATENLATFARIEETENRAKTDDQIEQEIEQIDLKLIPTEPEKGDKNGDSEKAETPQSENEKEGSDRAKKQAKNEPEIDAMTSSKSPEAEQATAQDQEQKNEQTPTTKSSKSNKQIKQKTVAKSSKRSEKNEQKISDAELLRYAKKIRSKIGETPPLKILLEKANSKYQAEKIRKQLTAEEQPKLKLIKSK
jgi:hypothetical protein